MAVESIRVLLVEDNPADSRLIQEMLRERVFDVEVELETAGSLAEAAERAAGRAPEVVLLDLGLPDGQGVQSVERIKESAPRAAVVVLTGLDDEATAVDSLRAGAQDYMAKSRADGESLMRAMRYARERKQAKEALELGALRLEALLELSRMTQEDLDRVSDFVQEKSMQLTGSEFSLLSFVEEDGRSMVVHNLSRPVRERCRLPQEDGRFDLESAGLLRKALDAGAPVVVNDYGPDVPGAGGLPEGHIPLRRVLLAPLMEGGRPRALLAVANKEDPYDDQDAVQASLLLEGLGVLLRERRQHEELVAAKEAAEAASRAKSAFLANMSHEFRTPLNAILGFTNLTLAEDLDETQRRNLEMVRDSGTSFLRLLDDLLDFSRIEAGKMVLKPEPFRLDETVRGVLDMFRSEAEDKGLELKLALAPDTPLRLVGDEGRLRQVLVNLLGNALKYTEQGEVELNVSPAKDAKSEAVQQQRRIVLFQVRDTGCGVPDEAREVVFKGFTQLDDSSNRDFSGAGLGLAICKRLVAMLEGEIWLESEPGKGSTFYFTAAFEPDQAEEQAPVAARREPGETDPQRILLAEDDRVNEMLARRLLERMGHSVASAGNGWEVLERLQAEPFDLVLMDIQMPGMDGLEAARRIRSGVDGVSPDIPVIALTAHAMRGDRERYLAEGMDDYLAKPIDFGELKAILARVVEAGGATVNRK
jgi:signal transduction histidine kinase/CheY-like chemotaxis protein